MIYLIGLGNFEEKYDRTRHNVGRDIIFSIHEKGDFKDWKEEKGALISKGKIGKESLTLILPQTYMNLSGKILGRYVKNKKDAEKTVVLHDDLDLGLSSLKLSFSKNSGGHRGVESLIKSFKTKDFWRLRVGISPMTPKGKVKKILNEAKVQKHVLSKFSNKEMEVFKKVQKKVEKGIEMFCNEGFIRATNYINTNDL